MRRLLPLLIVLVAASATDAAAHAPATAIGRAVTALEEVQVSYDPSSSVTDVEAANFNQIVAGEDVAVAFLPEAASTEIAGGSPWAIADEIGREAGLDGSLVVLVGSELGAWSADIDEDRLAELVGEAQAGNQASPVAAVDDLVRTVAAEPTGGSVPWGWLGAALVVLAVAALVAADLLGRRRP